MVQRTVWDFQASTNRIRVQSAAAELYRAELKPQTTYSNRPGSPLWPEATQPNHPRSLSVLLQLPPPGRTAPTSARSVLRLWWSPDLRHYEGLFTFTAGEHGMVAGIAQVGVRLTRLALGPYSESQATAVTALLRETDHHDQALRVCLASHSLCACDSFRVRGHILGQSLW